MPPPRSITSDDGIELDQNGSELAREGIGCFVIADGSLEVAADLEAIDGRPGERAAGIAPGEAPAVGLDHGGPVGGQPGDQPDRGLGQAFGRGNPGQLPTATDGEDGPT